MQLSLLTLLFLYVVRASISLAGFGGGFLELGKLFVHHLELLCRHVHITVGAQKVDSRCAAVFTLFLRHGICFFDQLHLNMASLLEVGV